MYIPPNSGFLKQRKDMPEKFNVCRKASMLDRLIRMKWFLETFWVLSKKFCHFESCWKGYSSMNGKPVPWLNYSAIEFLECYAPHEGYVLEYGVGTSTLWWLNRGLFVNGIERSRDWAMKIGAIAGRSMKLNIHVQDELSKYPMEYKLFPGARERYDVIVVDGEIEQRSRLHCLRQAKKLISVEGIIIVDNIDWLPDTREEALHDKDFFCVPISGFTPGLPYTTTCLFMLRNPVILQERVSRFRFGGDPFSRGAIRQDLESPVTSATMRELYQ
jgi:hypothetical protein